MKPAELVRDKPGKIQFSESFEGDAKAIFSVVDDMGLEGMVSKRADSRYKSGLSKSWLKAKCFGDLEVLGVVREPGEAPMTLMAKPAWPGRSPAFPERRGRLAACHAD